MPGCVSAKAWRVYSPRVSLGKRTWLNPGSLLAYQRATEGHPGSTLTLSLDQLWTQPVCPQPQGLQCKWTQAGKGEADGITHVDTLPGHASASTIWACSLTFPASSVTFSFDRSNGWCTGLYLHFSPQQKHSPTSSFVGKCSETWGFSREVVAGCQ